jgi:hypothetical protein
MGIMSKVVKIGIAKKLYDEARKPHNQQKARDAWTRFQANRGNRSQGPPNP